jgi:hypothetical protein
VVTGCTQPRLGGGDELWHERGGKEGGVGCVEMMRGQGAFYSC